MIAQTIEYSIRNRYIVLVLTAAVALWGVYCVMKTPVDAIPDLSENQVIVFADWMGRAPQEIDDQITYPLSVALQGLAGVRTVRSSSEFNFSMITIIFDEGTDFYFARTRVLERLAETSTYLPAGVVPYLAPDATALGQIFWYTVEGDGYSPDELRAIQDWYVRYQLYVAGVAQVASVGGFVREYQVDVDPARLRALNLPLGAVYSAIARSNAAMGGKVYVQSQAEYLIRGVGWLRGMRDLENLVVAERGGVPITVRQVATVQLGPQFRRSMLEKNGGEAVGGVVMMRYAENPLAVTRAIKERIEQLQPGLPKGVRIVPFYDRTRLIEGAIHTLTGTLREELIIATVAIILILMHLRSALVVCATLPLAVLIAFILMHYLGISSNIMSLSGIAISIGILVDAAVVMVENATHELTKHFGQGTVHGDTTEIVVRSCRLVGQPIFFAVTIMLISFLPVFALTGMEGKMFRPLAFTKTFAMVGVALLAITFVPAMIPIFIKGRLKSEERNWIVRSFINIYKPVLTWLMNYPAAGLWLLALLFIIGLSLAGVFGRGAAWPVTVLLALLLYFGAVFFRRWWSRIAALALLVVAALWAWDLPKLGREFMPPLDEGSILDMPVTAPRVSIAQAADDVRLRDAIMADFPEVEQVVGKVGRAETPTDPAGPEMIETVVTLRPKELWPKRKLRFDDALAEARLLAAALEERSFIAPGTKPDQASSLANGAAMAAMQDFDRRMRELAHRRQTEYEPLLADKLVRQAVGDLLRHFRAKGRLKREPTEAEIGELVAPLAEAHGRLLVEIPRQEEMNLLIDAATEQLAGLGTVEKSADLLLPPSTAWYQVRESAAAAFGAAPPSLFRDLFDNLVDRRESAWRERVKILNWEIEDVAAETMDGLLLETLCARAAEAKLLAHPGASRRAGIGASGLAAKPDDETLKRISAERTPAFKKSFFLWHKTKEDILNEMNSELQMPGWGNIWTQPIINRVDMLATGVRTMIGVKVFGPRLEDVTEETTTGGATKTVVKEKGIQTICNEIAAALKDVPGAVDVSPDQATGRTYFQVEIDRERAARYGVNVADIQEAIEVAMGGETITTTVEGRRRFPVRVRYAPDFRQTPEELKNVLVTARPGAMAPMGAGGPGGNMGAAADSAGAASGELMQIPIGLVADIRVVEGPSMIKSENGMLRSYVQLNVRDRDIVGFVEEAQRVVAERVKLPQGFFIEWSGQFEHLIRARRTFAIIFPLVLLLIFIILYATFKDWRDALLIILCVPGALVGGVIFQSLFGFNFSVAVWVGFIACFGMATQTGVVMLVYLHDAIRQRGGLAGIKSSQELRETVIAGAVHRLRPKLMTEGVAIVGLMPMLWATGVGAEVAKPMAAPVLGGLLVADEVIDLVLPVIFHWYQQRRWRRQHAPAAAPQ